jgi:fructoselysine 6-kinase
LSSLHLRLLGLGDNVVDDYLHERVMYPGGNALNFAVYARLLGHDAAYLGLFGNDAAGRHVQSVAARLGIDLSHCRELAGPNGHAELTVVQGDRVFLGSNRGGVRENASLDFIFDDTAYLAGFDLIHTSLYSYVDAILPRLAGLGTPLSYDFSDDFEEVAALGLCRYLAFAFFSCAERSEQATRALLEAAVAAGCGIADRHVGRGRCIHHGFPCPPLPRRPARAGIGRGAGPRAGSRCEVCRLGLPGKGRVRRRAGLLMRAAPNRRLAGARP